jgi:flagellar biosynthesis/type III secretory pathway protein FliH
MALIKHANLKDLARDAVVLDLGDLARQGQALVAQARAKADQILAEAQAERARLIAGATEEGRAAGYAAGLERGLGEGRATGQAEALAERRERLTGLEEQWKVAVDSFLNERQNMLAEARRDLLRLACEIAGRVTHRQIELDPGVAVSQLEGVLHLVMRPTRLLVRVHPLDRQLVQDALPTLMQRFVSVGHVELAEDAALERGSCVARIAEGAGGAPGGEINAEIGVQLDRIVDALLPGARVARTPARAEAPAGSPAPGADAAQGEAANVPTDAEQPRDLGEAGPGGAV